MFDYYKSHHMPILLKAGELVAATTVNSKRRESAERQYEILRVALDNLTRYADATQDDCHSVAGTERISTMPAVMTAPYGFLNNLI